MEDKYIIPSFATLSVSDLKRSIDFYSNVLGFKIIYLMGSIENPIMCHLRYSRYADLMLVPDSDFAFFHQKGHGLLLNFAYNEDSIDDFYNIVKDQYEEVFLPINRPWNVRDMLVIDPDGYRINFIKHLESDTTSEVVIDNN